MRTHIKVVALINIAFGALGVLAGIVVLLGGTFGSMFSGSMGTAIVGTAVSGIVGILIAALSGIGVVAGIGLLSGRPWARYLTIVCSVFSLLRFPFGTIFGIYSLWVMFNAETQRIFSEAAA